MTSNSFDRDVYVITGASGFIGGALVKFLLTKKRENDLVKICVRDLNQPIPYLEEVKHKISIVQANINDFDSLKEAFKDANYIYHCAGKVSDWAPYEEFHKANIDGANAVCEAARTCTKLKRLVWASSTDIYGFVEGTKTEKLPGKYCGSYYADTKLEGEFIARIYMKRLPICILRIANVYGPRAQYVVEVIHALKNRDPYVTSKNVRGGFVYIDHVCQAFWLASHNEKAIGQIFNVADERQTTWGEFFEAFAKKLKCSPPSYTVPFLIAFYFAWILELIYYQIWGYSLEHKPFLTTLATKYVGLDQYCDATLIRETLGFREFVSFEEGIERSWKWYSQEASEDDKQRTH